MPGVTVRHVVKKETFQTYVFGTSSTLVWETAFITDIIDPANPLGRKKVGMQRRVGHNLSCETKNPEGAR